MMAIRCVAVLAALYSTVAAFTARADSQGAVAVTSADQIAQVELLPLLDAVSKQADKKFLVSSKVPSRVTVGQFDVKQLTYPLLLSVLRNNGLAGVTVEGVVNIVPVQDARLYPTRIIVKEDPDIPEDEWITAIVHVKSGGAPAMIPILRPLVQQAGHMAAYGGHAILLADRYGNVRRIMQIVQQLADDPPPSARPGKQ